MPRSSSVFRISTTCGRSTTSRSSSRMPSQTVLSRSHTTHLIDCLSFFFFWISACAGGGARRPALFGLHAGPVGVGDVPHDALDRLFVLLLLLDLGLRRRRRLLAL